MDCVPLPLSYQLIFWLFALFYPLCSSLKSGTGKTATFAISALQSIDTQSNQCQVLVLSPTRELAQQIQKVGDSYCLGNEIHIMTFVYEIGLITQVIVSLGEFMSARVWCCVGGKSVGEDIRRLEQGQQIVSGTPGRVIDMIQRRALRTRDIKMFILDEADEMLSLGFKEQIYDVYRYLPPATQVCLIPLLGLSHCSGYPSFRHPPCRSPRHDQQIHEQAHAHPCQA